MGEKKKICWSYGFYIFIKIKYKYLFFYSMVIGLSIFIQNEIFMNIIIDWNLNKDRFLQNDVNESYLIRKISFF